MKYDSTMYLLSISYPYERDSCQLLIHISSLRGENNMPRLVPYLLASSISTLRLSQRSQPSQLSVLSGPCVLLVSMYWYVIVTSASPLPAALPPLHFTFTYVVPLELIRGVVNNDSEHATSSPISFHYHKNSTINNSIRSIS